MITDQTNTTLWSWESDPFGATAANEDPDGDGVAFVYNLRFPGQYFDEETNLHYNYFRDYDPSTGRYVQSDPIGVLRDYSDPRLQVAIEVGVLEDMSLVSEGLNHNYAYAENSPQNFIDPRGTNAFVSNQIARVLCLIPSLCSSNNDGGMCPAPNNANRDADDEDEKDKGCEAIRESMLSTCASLSGTARMKCIFAAKDAYNQCMNAR